MITEMITEVDDLALPHALRRKVFIEEQGYAEADEWDALDELARHLILWDMRTDPATPVGTARIFVEGGTGRIGRVCVLVQARGTGLGAMLIDHAVALLREAGCHRAVLGAQVRAMGFYERLGFVATGPEYDDGGVPHREMERPLGMQARP